jgi:hypothetical protein
MTQDYFRKIINTLEQINESKIGRLAKGSRSQWVAGQHISNAPIPFADNPPDENDADWMKRAAFGDDFKNLKRVYFDEQNKKLPFVGGWSDRQNAYVYFPDNTAKTMGELMANKIRAILTRKGMKEGEDFIIDQQHEVLRIFKKTK